ncbi:hypothetical protein HK102_010953, partial [Quaeritorhiza haematococci]
NYAVDEYYREALRMSNKAPTQKAPKPPKLVNISDFQFYPPRVMKLQEKEILYYRKSINYKIPKKTADDEKLSEKELEKRWKEEQDKIDNAEPLTEDEIAEKEKLLQQGFENWSKREFTAFVKANEKYGRYALDQIANDIEGKTLAEVKEYAKVFWKRYKEIA